MADWSFLTNYARARGPGARYPRRSPRRPVQCLLESPLMQLSAGFRLADLYQVAIRVSQEAADLGAPVMRRGEERGAPGPQRLIGCLAVSHTQRHRVTDPIGVSGRLEEHGGLVGGRAAPADQQQPGTGEPQHDARSPVLAVQFGAQHADPEIPRPCRVG